MSKKEHYQEGGNPQDVKTQAQVSTEVEWQTVKERVESDERDRIMTESRRG